MLNGHSKVGIALIVFYGPALALAAALYIRHGRPRASWIVLSLFCSVRMACGIVLLVHQTWPNDFGLTVASFILLNAGFFPLVAATIGLFRIMTALDVKSGPNLRTVHLSTRILLLAGIVLIVVGGSLAGRVQDESDVLTGTRLVKAGYIVTAVFIACLIGSQVAYWKRRRELSSPSLTILKATSMAMPFVIVRVTYMFLSIYRPHDSRWDSLSGAIGPLVVMVLLMEYSVVCIYIVTGYIIPVAGKYEVQAYEGLQERLEM